MKGKRASRPEWTRLAQREAGARWDEVRAPRCRQGARLNALYTSEDLDGLSHLDTLPGQAPFVRGPRATMYRGRPWTLRQYAGFSTAEETNAFFLRALEQGQRGLSVAFDLATHRGYDSDHPRVRGDVGKAGVAIDSVEDMARLFEGIDLGQVSVSMTMNGAVLPVLAAFVVVAEERGVSPAQLQGTIQNDILKEFMVRNTFIYPPEPSMRIVADVIAYASRAMPRFNTVSISGYHMQEAGATAAQELAFTIGDGLEYVGVALDRGLRVEDFAPRLSFFFGVGVAFFVEVAKLRAARLLWSELLAERFGVTDPKSLMLRMHCQTSGVSLTAQEPLNNVIRTTIEAMAAVLGGTQSLHTNAYDEAIALPSDGAARLARNTQLILQHEGGLGDVIDPFGGSYFIEALTHQLAGEARQLLDEVKQRGGMARAVAEGYPQSCIERASVERQARVDRGDEVIIGVNRFEAGATAEELDVRYIDHVEVLKTQQQRLEVLRRDRDEARVEAALDALRRGAEAQRHLPEPNLLALSVEAMRARCTVGEVSSTVESVYGRFERMVSAVRGAYGKELEADPAFLEAQEQVRRLAQHRGRPPRILIAKIGQDGHDRGAKIVATGLSDLGWDVDLGPLFSTPEEVARLAVDADVHLVGVSTQAGAHRLLVPQLIDELARLGAGDIGVVCGGIIPPPDRRMLEEAGVLAIVDPGTSIVEMGRRLLGLLQ